MLPRRFILIRRVIATVGIVLALLLVVLTRPHSGSWLGFVPLWFLCATGAVVTFFEIRWKMRRRRWGRTGFCIECGYDLRATPDRCPECGAVPAEAKP
jgi:hypothetical protein